MYLTSLKSISHFTYSGNETMSHEEEVMFLGLDFHTSKEITPNDAGPDSIVIPLNHVQRKNVKQETMFYNLTKPLTGTIYSI